MKILKSMNFFNEDLLTREVNKLKLTKDDIQKIVYDSNTNLFILFYWEEEIKEDIDKKYNDLINKYESNNEEDEEDYGNV